MRTKNLLLLFLSFVFILSCSPQEAALALAVSDFEVVVPAEGLTELDLKSGVCIYRGQPERPIRVLVSSPQMQLTAVTIIYDQEKQLLTANQQVELEAEEDGVQVAGEQLEITEEWAKLPAGGRIVSTTEEASLVSSGTLCYLRAEEIVQATGGFTLFYEDWSLSGDQLEANLADGFFTGRGALSFEHPEVAGEAERIEYDQKNELITLTGSPHLRWADGWLQGAEETVIIYDLTSGKAKAVGPTKMRFSQDTVVNPDGD
ncbi:MAG: hypothetical protein GX050_06570 [Firmicutes bacterium]|nr:hypothetical protein [Bacillota bacterium]